MKWPYHFIPNNRSFCFSLLWRKLSLPTRRRDILIVATLPIFLFLILFIIIIIIIAFDFFAFVTVIVFFAGREIAKVGTLRTLGGCGISEIA